MPDRVRLPIRFDAPALAEEAVAIPSETWTPHFNQAVHEGNWTGVALRAVGGAPLQLYPDPAARAPFADTELLKGLPAHRAALARFGCPITSARLLALAPGAVIKQHSDLRLRFEDGEIRVHVPVTTDAEVQFVLDGRPVEMAAGEAWYLDLTRPHAVSNRSAITRVHLVVDCVVDEWLTSLVREALCEGAGDRAGCRGAAADAR